MTIDREDTNFSERLLFVLKKELGVTWVEPDGVLQAAQAAFYFKSHLISSTSRVVVKDLKDRYREINKLSRQLKKLLAGLPVREKNSLTYKLWSSLLEPVYDDIYLKNGFFYEEPKIDIEKLHDGMNVVDIVCELGELTEVDDEKVKEGKYRQFISGFCYQYARLKYHHQDRGTSIKNVNGTIEFNGRGNRVGGREAAKQRINEGQGMILKIAAYVICYEVVNDYGESLDSVIKNLNYSFKEIFEAATEKALDEYWKD